MATTRYTKSLAVATDSKTTNHLGIGTDVFDSTADKTITITNGTAPAAAVTNGVQIYAADTAVEAKSTLALETEQVVEAIGVFTASHKLKVVINGAEYWIQLDAV